MSLLGLCSIWLTVFFDRAVMPDVISTRRSAALRTLSCGSREKPQHLACGRQPIFSTLRSATGTGCTCLLATFLPPHVAQIISFYFVAIGGVIFELARIQFCR